MKTAEVVLIGMIGILIFPFFGCEERESVFQEDRKILKRQFNQLSVDAINTHLGTKAANYDIVEVWRERYTELGDKVDYALLKEKSTGKIEKLALSSMYGKTSFTEMRLRQFAEKTKKYGKLGEELSKELGNLSKTAKVKVNVWYPYSPAMITKAPPNNTATIADMKAFLKLHRQAQEVANKSALDAAVKAIKKHGGKITSASTTQSVIEAELSAGNVLNAASEKSVVKIKSKNKAGKTLSHRLGINLNNFWDYDESESWEEFHLGLGGNACGPNGCDGTGIHVGHYEDSGECAIWWGPQPAVLSWNSINQSATSAQTAVRGCDWIGEGQECDSLCNNDEGYCQGGKCVKRHASTCSSAMGAGPYGGEYRNAYKADLYWPNAPGDHASKLAWFANNNVQMINISQIMSQSNSGPWDNQVRYNWATLTMAAGNIQANYNNCYGNSICVGNYNVRAPESNWVDTWWADPGNQFGIYAMDNFTCWRDRHPDMEKPDVVTLAAWALGYSPETPGGMWRRPGMTSMAAPLVGGLVAMAQQYHPSLLTWPEMVRPLLMASALHSIHGTFLSTNGMTDERDGAGAPKANVLKAIVDGGSAGKKRGMVGFSLTPSTAYPEYMHQGTIEVEAFETVRVVFNYMMCGTEDGSYLPVDFDLYLYDVTSGKEQVAYSASGSSNVEMLEYYNWTSSKQTLQVGIKAGPLWFGCNGHGAFEYAGLAWVVYKGGVMVP